MSLARRLLLGAVTIVAVLVVVIVSVINRELERRVRQQFEVELTHSARAVASLWVPGVSSDSLADALGTMLAHRVTLIDQDGVVRGDADFDGDALAHLQNHADRPEVVAARAGGVGIARRQSASAGDEELYVAVQAPRGVARVSVPTREVVAAFEGARRSVYFAGVIAAGIALVLAWLFSRAVSRPIVELRDVARSLADGDLARRPPIAAPGEVGELAVAVHRLAEQLGTRISALEAEDALLRTLFDSLNEGVLAVDADGVVTRINETGRRLLGIRDVPPFPADRLPRDRTLRDKLAAALAGEIVESGEATLGGATLAVTARPLRAGGAVLAVYDLSPVRRLETVRRDFVANVSHELRTPLTIIGGFAETLSDPSLPADRRESFSSAILTNTRRMQRIVDDLLDLSRIESGGWVPNAVWTDLAAAATETIAPFVHDAHARGVELTTEIAADASRVHADPTALRQILANLVDNALRHTSSGSVVVFARRSEGGIAFGVRDTGAGIPAEHVDRIFERFYRVDAGRSREHGGTGLGLAIVRHLVDAHRGTVRAESVLGRGTTIEVRLPNPESET